MFRSARAKRTVSDGLGPFVPGAGGVPRCLAGREREQIEIRDFLRTIGSGEPPPSMLIFYGPRGNGKTTMLNWTSRQALEQGIRSVRLDTSQIRTKDPLAKNLSPDSWLTSILEGFSWRGTEVRSRRPETATTTKALARLVKNRPTILLIDEAHTLEPTVGTRLLQAAQRLASEGRPLLLALAGTPILSSHLQKMHANFWETSVIFPLLRLDDRASAEAIRIPFEQEGYQILPEALETIVEDSHGYPYFLQLWGRSLWIQARVLRADRDGRGESSPSEIRGNEKSILPGAISRVEG